MRILTVEPTGTMALRAPAAGGVLFHPPRALCGELEVFEAGETIASIGAARLDAPARGFVVRLLAADGDRVEESAELVIFRTA